MIQIKDGDYKALVNKLDQMTDTTHLSVTVSSDIQADAKYTAILWADQNIGDGTLAEKKEDNEFESEAGLSKR